MKRLIVISLLLIASAWSASAQAPPAADKAPTLTDVQKQTGQATLQAAVRANDNLSSTAIADAIVQLIDQRQRAWTEAEPKTLRVAIADLIDQRQKAAQLASQEFSAFYKSVAVEGYTLNPQTWVYEAKKK